MIFINIWLVGALSAFVVFSIAIASLDWREVASPAALTLYALWPLAVLIIVVMFVVVTVRSLSRRERKKRSRADGG